MYCQVTGRPNIPIGELADDGSGVLDDATVSTGGAGVTVNWMVGGLNTSTNFGGTVENTVGLIKVGTGTWTLTGPNITYTGPTIVSNGTMVFTGAAPATSSTYTLAAPGMLDVSAVSPLSVGSITPAVVQGNGTLLGSLIAGAETTLYAGFSNAIGTLTVTNTVDLSNSGTNYFELNEANLVGGTNSQLAATNIILGGTLWVTNIGPALNPGDTFKLFKSPVITGTFATVNIATTDAGTNIYTWQDHTAIDGTITVLTASYPFSSTPTNLTSSLVAGGPTGLQIQLAWPANHVGWRLLMQTNSPTVGLIVTNTNAWTPVTGANLTNQVLLPISTTNETFFEMIYP
jgi:autotransporter-associated beta strand protein